MIGLRRCRDAIFSLVYSRKPQRWRPYTSFVRCVGMAIFELSFAIFMMILRIPVVLIVQTDILTATLCIYFYFWK